MNFPQHAKIPIVGPHAKEIAAEMREEQRLKRERKRYLRKQPLPEYTGRRSGISDGTAVTDLAELQKCILLCPACRPKFDSVKYHYVPATRWGHVIGRCNAKICGHHNRTDLTLFFHESLVGVTYDPE